MRVGKLGEGLTAIRSDYRVQCIGIKRRVTFKGPIVEATTANKHGHATPPLNISSVDVRRPVTLLIVQIIEILIPFTLALTVRTCSDVASDDPLFRSAYSRGCESGTGCAPQKWKRKRATRTHPAGIHVTSICFRFKQLVVESRIFARVTKEILDCVTVEKRKH